jgi:hypothetical protein
MKSDQDVIRWLLEGDAAIRWQVLRDLMGASRERVARERRRVGTEGWGARLLELQDPSGTWGGGLYTPKWTSTTYSLLLLRDFGLPTPNEAAAKACALLLDHGLCTDGGVNFGRRDRSETCITGMILSILSYFRYDDARLDTILDHLLAVQMSDGGWNCRRLRGATHASVHTTISVLEGLRLYREFRRPRARQVEDALTRAREFLLVHRLYRSHRTGRIIHPAFTRFAFPPRWHYDVLRALDHFQATGAPRDPRLADAIALVRSSRGGDGRWPLNNEYKGKLHFRMERLGAPSRWNTLRALRVLEWWGDEGGVRSSRKGPTRFGTQQPERVVG